jgi:poly(A) polymerase
MSDPAAVAVIAALEAEGGAGCARFVGGCVRNALMKRPVDDVDIATTVTPDRTVETARRKGLKAVPTGIDHGTVTVVSEGRPFEVTTLRRDVETDGRRAVVAFTRDWSEDAQRRDFRMNAIYAAPDGELFDPTGDGVDDALRGRIVFVGDAETRVREDYLRILRFFRFYAWYGRGAPDPHGLETCARLKEGIDTLSAERVAKELLKLLAAHDPRPALRLMAGAGVLAKVLPWPGGSEVADRLIQSDLDEGAPPDPELRLAALLPRDPEVAAEAARRLRLSNAQRDRLVAAAGPAEDLEPGMTDGAARRALYRQGPQTIADRAKLAAARADGDRAPWRPLLALADGSGRPALPLGGEDVAALGIPKGPKVGGLLRDLEAWWMDADFPSDRERALAELRRLAQAQPDLQA